MLMCNLEETFHEEMKNTAKQGTGVKRANYGYLMQGIYIDFVPFKLEFEIYSQLVNMLG